MESPSATWPQLESSSCAAAELEALVLERAFGRAQVGVGGFGAPACHGERVAELSIERATRAGVVRAREIQRRLDVLHGPIERERARRAAGGIERPSPRAVPVACLSVVEREGVRGWIGTSLEGGRQREVMRSGPTRLEACRNGLADPVVVRLEGGVPSGSRGAEEPRRAEERDRVIIPRLERCGLERYVARHRTAGDRDQLEEPERLLWDPGDPGS
jgi:hypothetical protein